MSRIEIIKYNTSTQIANNKLWFIDKFKIVNHISEAYFVSLIKRRERLKKHIEFLTENV